MIPLTANSALQGIIAPMHPLLSWIVLQAHILDYQDRMSCQIACSALQVISASTQQPLPLLAPQEATETHQAQSRKPSARPALLVTTAQLLPSIPLTVQLGHTMGSLDRLNPRIASSALLGSSAPTQRQPPLPVQQGHSGALWGLDHRTTALRALQVVIASLRASIPPNAWLALTILPLGAPTVQPVSNAAMESIRFRLGEPQTAPCAPWEASVPVPPQPSNALLIPLLIRAAHLS